MNENPLSIDWKPLGSVPGLGFRYFAGEEDYQIRLDIINACKEVNGVDWIQTLEDIENETLWTNNYDIHKQLIYVELEGKPIGYFGYSWDTEITRMIIYYPFGNLLPSYWGRGIASLMLSYAEERCLEIADTLHADKAKRFRIWKKKKARQTVAFLQDHGYQIERYFFLMRRPIDLLLGQHPFPEGLEIRPVDPEHYRAIWDGEQEAFRDHWGYSEPTDPMFEAWQKGRLFQPEYWKVAWEGDQVCGMVGNFIDPEENKTYNRKRGYTEDIWVRLPWRKKGLAKALIAESIRMFRDMGMEETCLNVDAENTSGALKLYQRMGYEVEEDKTSTMLFKAI